MVLPVLVAMASNVVFVVVAILGARGIVSWSMAANFTSGRHVLRLSKTGSLLAALYTIAAGFLFHEAMTCGGWLCDLVAFPV